jgi:hypothetical protein
VIERKNFVPRNNLFYRHLTRSCEHKLSRRKAILQEAFVARANGASCVSVFLGERGRGVKVEVVAVAAKDGCQALRTEVSIGNTG